MLGRAHRFHGHGSLRYVYQNGKNIRGTYMGVRACQNTRRKKYRVAVVVSKKVHKSAVVRNRIRRRVYELVRKHETLVPANYDLVITVFSNAVATLPASELEERLLYLFGQLDLTEASKPAPRDIIEPKET